MRVTAGQWRAEDSVDRYGERVPVPQDRARRSLPRRFNVGRSSTSLNSSTQASLRSARTRRAFDCHAQWCRARDRRTPRSRAGRWCRSPRSSGRVRSLRVECVTCQLLERDDFERLFVGRGEVHRRCGARFECLAPASGAQAPAVAGLQAGKLVLGLRRERSLPCCKENSRNSAAHCARTPCANRHPAARCGSNRRGRNQLPELRSRRASGPPRTLRAEEGRSASRTGGLSERTRARPGWRATRPRRRAGRAHGCWQRRARPRPPPSWPARPVRWR